MYDITNLLEFKLNEAGDAYSILTCKDEKDLPKTVELPSEYKGLPVTSIEDYALMGFKNVGEIIFPDSITSIGFDILKDCRNIYVITASDDILDQLDGFIEEEVLFYDLDGYEYERIDWGMLEEIGESEEMDL
jgi:hypothetical protein